MKLGIGILAGGKSTRMGKNKALIKYNEKTFLEAAVEQGLNFDEVIVSVDKIDKYKDALEKYVENNGILIVEDKAKEYGPLEGIKNILEAAKCEYVFVRAVDMPLMKKEFVNKLTYYMCENFLADKQFEDEKENNLEIEKRNCNVESYTEKNSIPEYDCVIVKDGDKLEPLCSIYSKKLLPYIKKMIKNNQHKIMKLFDEKDIKVKYVDINELGEFACCIKNVNTEEDLNSISIEQ